MKFAFKSLVTVIAAFSAAHAQQYIISTIAGGAPPLSPSAATQASIGAPQGVFADAAGNVYLSSLDCVFKVDSSGVLSLVAGNARPGYSGDGGAATSAQLDNPFAIAVDSGGNIYIADAGNNRIRKVSPAGIIVTVAGGGLGPDSGDGGPATSASLGFPNGIALDAAGNLYIADSGNNAIRKVSAGGVTSTIAGGGPNGYSGDGGPAAGAHFFYPTGVAVDSRGNVYIADTLNNRIRKISTSGIITTIAGGASAGYSGDGGPATGALLNNPRGVAIDAKGNVLIADTGNYVVRKISSNGVISTVAGQGSGSYSGDGGPATSAYISQPWAVASDAGGNMYVADTGNSVIRKVDAAGVITTVAGDGFFSYGGDGGPATQAQFFDIAGLVVDPAGNLYLADSGNSAVRRIDAAGFVTALAGYGYYGYSGDGGPATSSTLNTPKGLALDTSGNLYIADTGNSVIRMVSPSGTINTVAGTGSASYSGDGGPAAAAGLNSPFGVAVDGARNLFIADTANNVIRKVSASGIISTVAGAGSAGYSGDGGPATNAQLSGPTGLALDSAGNLFIADTGSNAIRELSPSGIITTVAGSGSSGYSGDGGPAADAQLTRPRSVSVDSRGNLYIADFFNSVIRKVTPTGIIFTIAGDGLNSYTGDGGPATNAALASPNATALDAHGDLYVSDSGNGAIRLASLPSSSCTYSVSPSSLQVPDAGGNSAVTITTGGDCLWAVSNLPAWIFVPGPSTGSGSASISLTVSANPAAARSIEILIGGVAMTINQAGNAAPLSIGAGVNSADYSTGVAPGSIASFFGNFLVQGPLFAYSFPIPTSLGGLSLEFSGVAPARLFYAASGQVNAQVPWELSGQSQATITATSNGQTSAPITVKLATYAPGIYSINGQGSGQGAILDATYRLVDATNPATAGSDVVQIYCTGLGPVTNQPATGSPAPGNPLAATIETPAVTIGGVPAKVVTSVLAPGYAGLYQINAQIPSASAKGPAVPVVISIGGVTSNTVTMAVK